MKTATRPQYHRLQRILEMVREGTRSGSLPNCRHFIRFKDAFGINQADQPWNVRLLFAREMATYIRERIWHPSQQLRQRRDDALDLRLQTHSRKELTRWVLSWMPHVRVLAPRELRKRVWERLRQGLLACA